MSDPSSYTVAMYWDQRGTRPDRHTGVGKHVIAVLEGLLRRPDVSVRILIARDQVDLWQELAEALEKKKEKGSARELCHFSHVGPEEEKNAQLHGLTPFSVGPEEEKHAQLHGLTPFSPSDGNNDKMNCLTPFVKILPWTCLQIRFWGLFTHLPGAASALEGCDVIYSPQEEVLTAKGLPSVNTLHGFPELHEEIPLRLRRSLPCRREAWKHRLLMRRARRACARSFVVSGVLADEVEDRFGLTRDHMVQVGNGVENLFFDTPLPSRPGSTAPLAVVGGINAYDGAPAMVEVLRGLAPHPVVVFGDRYEEPWISEVRSMSHVTLKGFVSGPELRQGLSESLALLYLPNAESFGIIGLEALALGLPVIAHRVEGLPETLGDRAFWVEAPVVSEVREAMSRVQAQSDASYQDGQQAGRARAEQFTWEKVTEKVVEGLSQCI